MMKHIKSVTTPVKPIINELCNLYNCEKRSLRRSKPVFDFNTIVLHKSKSLEEIRAVTLLFARHEKTILLKSKTGLLRRKLRSSQ